MTLGAGWAAAPAAHAADPVPSETATVEDPTGNGVVDAAEVSARFVVTSQPAPRAVYGTPTKVAAALVTDEGVGVPAQDVELLARIWPSSQWRRVAFATTDAEGKVTLSVTLPSSAALRLRHPAGTVAAPDEDLGSVVVAKSVTAAAGPTRTREGVPVVVRGRVAPAQPVGSPVRLQRRVGGSWSRVASGRMITGERYRIRWTPQRPGRYLLRVVKPRDALRAAGASAEWRHRVLRETAAHVARDILHNDRITLARVHVYGGGYLGSAHQNVVDIGNGRPARYSCHAGAPCGSTRVDLRLLRAVRDMGSRGTLTVSEIAGGVHTGGSAHYSGRGVDITRVNGRRVGRGASYGMVVDRCRAYGATEIFTPSNDPYGGHHNHVHCAWE